MSRSKAVPLWLLIVSIAILSMQITYAKEDALLNALRDNLEKIVDQERPQPLSEYVEIPVSSSLFESYKMHSKQLADQLGSQDATRIELPGEIHLFITKPSLDIHQIMEHLAKGTPLSGSGSDGNCDTGGLSDER